MAVVRVSSYRRLFQGDRCAGDGGRAPCCGGQSRPSDSECGCDWLDSAAARTVNQTAVVQFVGERRVIADLNDRLVNLMEVARCFEEENETLEQHIRVIKQKLDRPTHPEVSTHSSLDAVVARLVRQREEVLMETEELKEELQQIQTESQRVEEQRILLQQEREEITEEVDAVTVQCLSLREQESIFQEQLVDLEERHCTEENDGAVPFSTPDLKRFLDRKGLKSQLTPRLQCECGVSSAKGSVGDGGETGGLTVGEGTVCHQQVLELQKEFVELKNCNEELQKEVQMKEASYEEEITELECVLEERRQQELELQVLLKEQSEELEEVLMEKMIRDSEITAYRTLVEEERARLSCCL